MNAPESAAPARILALCAGDPESPRTFSGSARNLFNALEERGALHHKANVLGWTDPFDLQPHPAIRALRKLDRAGWEEAYRWSACHFARNSRRARRVAGAHPGAAACLMYGTTFAPPPDLPAYCYFDATAAQVREARAWEFERMSESRAQRAIAYQRGVFRRCAALFPRTQWAAESAVRDYGIPEDKVVPAGAGPNHPLDPRPHGPYDAQTLLFIGSEFERKGGPLVLEAFRRAHAALPNARLKIAGCAPPIDEPGIEVIGVIPKDAPGGLDRIRALYAEASLFCIMSAFEPFGIVILEAQDAGVPCVAPRRFAFPETIRHGETGELLDAGDPGALAEVFVRLLADPGKLAAMGEAGRRHVRERFTWARAAQCIHERIQRDAAASAHAEPARP